MRNASAVTTCKIVLGVSASFAIMSAAGCGATESTCKELQRTCGCDGRDPCPGDGAVGSAGGSAGGGGGRTGEDASDGSAADGDGAGVDTGSGRSGAGGIAGSGGTAGASGAGGKGGAAGARDDAATESGIADSEVDVDHETGDAGIDAPPDLGDNLDATGETDAIEASLDSNVMDIGPTCDVTKSPSVEGCLIDEQYGVFVSPVGDDSTGTGTRRAPYATIGTAIKAAAAQNLRIYACDIGVGYDEQLVLPDGTRLFGGFDCIDWAYSTTRRAIVRAPASPALAIHAALVGVLVEDIEVDAPDAVTPGGSSIGALIEGSSNVVLRRSMVAAGKGGEGAGGANGTKGSDGPEVTSDLVGSAAMCPATAAGQLGGAWLQPTSCGSRGGAGGTATQGSDGSAGVPGNPRVNVSPPNVDNGGPKGVTGSDGGAGSPGTAGAAGVATPTTGMFTSAGYTPASASQGATGADGYVGQGGGGGGASNAADLCIGASGGAGGMGGCGGKGGVGGAGGGASVALLSWTSTVTLDACELVAHAGGQGGKGGSGGAGGSGKAGAAGGVPFIADGGIVVGRGGRGGTGGIGGLGGPAAGGTGGPSYALVYKGQSPLTTTITLTPGAPGTGGLGGTSGSTTGPSGPLGQAAPEFPVP